MENEVIESQVVDGNTLAILTKAEIDQQITTAKAYPRAVTKFVDESTELVTMNEEVAGECFYVLPARKGSNKAIMGPSSRLGEIIMSCWGNCRGGARIVAEERDFIVAQGVFHDLERNVNVTMEIKRRITNRNGERYGIDMIGVTGNAACSIAFRNAIFKGIPKAFWESIYQKARKCAMGDVKTIEYRRSAMLAHLDENGISNDAVFRTLNIKGGKDLGLEELLSLKGILNAIKEGDTSYAQVFSDPETETGTSEATQKLTENVKTAAKKKTKKKAATKPSVEHEEVTVAMTPIDFLAKTKMIAAMLVKAKKEKDKTKIIDAIAEAQSLAADIFVGKADELEKAITETNALAQEAGALDFTKKE